jgi:uncharacterized BrkB/YihY/UPF0761 family membrane protein
MIRRCLAKRENPWELLILAFCFVLPGIALMLRSGPVDLFSQGRTLVWRTVLSPAGAHMWGVVAVVVGLLFVWLYFYVLRYEDTEQDKPPIHPNHLTKR